jgi:hypothetical protein
MEAFQGMSDSAQSRLKPIGDDLEGLPKNTDWRCRRKRYFIIVVLLARCGPFLEMEMAFDMWIRFEMDATVEARRLRIMDREVRRD